MLSSTPASAAAASEFSPLRARLRAEADAERPWDALVTAERCSALPGLTARQRADLFADEAELRSLVGDYAGAEEALRRALLLRPGNPDALLLMARLVRDRPETALEYAEEAARAFVSPRRRAAAHRLSAEIRIDLDDKAGARSSLERALTLEDDDLEALRTLAWLARERPAEASIYALRACESAAAYPSWQRAAAFRFCAGTLLEIEDYSRAITMLRRALDIDPDDLKALQLLLRIKRARPKAAAAPAGVPRVAPRASGNAGSDLEALRSLIEKNRAEGRLPEAIASAHRFTAAIREAPAWLRTDAYRMSVKIWLELGDVERARNSRRRADELNYQTLTGFPYIPGDFREELLGESYLRIVQARIDLGDAAEAEAALERALARYPDNFSVLEAMVRFKLNSRRKPDEALPYARRLVAAAEAASPADVLQQRQPEDALAKAILKSGVTSEAAIALYLEDPAAAEKAREELERIRHGARLTLTDVQRSISRTPPAPRD